MCAAAEHEALIGIWKLVSWQVIGENDEPQDVFGSNPKGYPILTREGRMMALLVADKRKGGMGERLKCRLCSVLVQTSFQETSTVVMKSGRTDYRRLVWERDK